MTLLALKTWSRVSVPCDCCGDPTFVKIGLASMCVNCVDVRARAVENFEALKIKQQRISRRTCPGDLRIDRAAMARFREHLAREQG